MVSFGLFPDNTPYFLPSTMMMWYPNPVLASAYFGLLVVLASSSNATATKAGSKSPLSFHPSAPPKWLSQHLLTRIVTHQMIKDGSVAHLFELCLQNTFLRHRQILHRSSTLLRPRPSYSFFHTRRHQNTATLVFHRMTHQNMPDIYLLRSFASCLLDFSALPFRGVPFPLRSHCGSLRIWDRWVERGWSQWGMTKRNSSK